jgi:hypothetical protein
LADAGLPPSTPAELADRLLAAFAGSDIETITELSTPGLVVFGTDWNEHWYDRGSLLAALAEMRALGLAARWLELPVTGEGWAAGTAEYSAAGTSSTAAVRVSFTFSAGRLVHAHFSVAQPRDA